MPTPPRPTPRESTEAMVRNIGRELAEIARAMGRCSGFLHLPLPQFQLLAQATQLFFEVVAAAALGLEGFTEAIAA